MLMKHVAPQSEVIRVIVLEDSPCCEVPHQERSQVRVRDSSRSDHVRLELVRRR